MCWALWLNRNMSGLNNMHVCTPVVHRAQSTWEAQLIWGSGHLTLSRQKESITIYFSQLRCNWWNPLAVCASSQELPQTWRTRCFDFIRSWILLLGPRYSAYDPSQTSLRKSCTPRHCYSWGKSWCFSVFINVTLGSFYSLLWLVKEGQREKISWFWNSRNEGAKIWGETRILNMLNFSNLPKKWKSLLSEFWEPMHSLLISSKRLHTELKINEKLEKNRALKSQWL